MKFGLFGGARARGGQADDSDGYHDFIRYIIAAEELGFSSAFLVEHHFTGFGQVSASLNLLSYLAARTEKIRLGTAVVVLPWHNPVLVAEEAATLDLLSNGRLDFGVGKGYRPYEFSGFCVPPEEASARFDEAMDVIRRAWTTKGRFSYEGKWCRYDNIVVEPAPIQQPHPPFWMGAGSPDFDPPRGARRLQPAARPDRADRCDHRPGARLPRGMSGGGARLRPDDGRRDARVADRPQR